MTMESESCHLGSRYLYTSRLSPLIKLCFDAKTRRCTRVANQIDNGFEATQGLATLVLSDVTK